MNMGPGVVSSNYEGSNRVRDRHSVVSIGETACIIQEEIYTHVLMNRTNPNLSHSIIRRSRAKGPPHPCTMNACGSPLVYSVRFPRFVPTETYLSGSETGRFIMIVVEACTAHEELCLVHP